MTTKDKELKILKAYYEKRHNNTEIDVKSFDLEDVHEGAFHLANLERDGYLKFEGTVLHPGGQRDQKYKNAIAAIWWSDAHITDRGERRLKEHNLIES